MVFDFISLRQGLSLNLGLDKGGGEQAPVILLLLFLSCSALFFQACLTTRKLFMWALGWTHSVVLALKAFFLH